MLKVENLCVSIDKENIIDNISFELNENDIMMILGPNGSGKTTTIRAIMNKVASSGDREIFNTDISIIKSKELAKKVGVLMQNHNIEFDLTVKDMVELGRYAYIEDLFGKLNKSDFDKIEDAMKITGVIDLKERLISTLSGGELQRVFIAQVLSQDPNILILDEPLNHLDLKNQIEIFEILKTWSKQKNKAIIAVVHDLNLAFKYANKAMLIKSGKKVAYGKVVDVLTRENLKEVYEIDVFEWMQQLIGHWK